MAEAMDLPDFEYPLGRPYTVVVVGGDDDDVRVNHGYSPNPE